MPTILASGLERALSLDWIGATEETNDASIEDYLEVIHRAVEHCGGRVNLIGDCQGGRLATNEHHVARYDKFEDWFKHTQDVRGKFGGFWPSTQQGLEMTTPVNLSEYLRKSGDL